MLRWMKLRLIAWVERVQQQKTDKLHRASLRLKAELLERNGGEPIRLTAEQRQRLAEKAKGINPEILKRIAVLEIEEPESPDADNTSAGSA